MREELFFISPGNRPHNLAPKFETLLIPYCVVRRGGSRTAATFKMERFMIIVNGWKRLTIITKRSILDAAAVLDPPLVRTFSRA